MTMGREAGNYIPEWLPVPVPDDADVGQSIANLERKLVEVEVRVEEVALVLAPGFKGEVLPVCLGEEVLLSLRRAGGDVVLFPHVLARPVGAFGVDDCLAFFAALHVLVAGVGLPFSCLGTALSLVADAQDVDGREESAVEIGLVAVHIAVKTRVDPPFYNAKGLVEERREAVADWVLEVVTEDELVARDVLLGREGEGYRVAVVGVLGCGEVGRGRGRAFGESYDALVPGDGVQRVTGDKYRGSP
jgi:hypothetical protein